MKIKISKIKIKKRIREDIGDITALVESIKRNGLINPITISDKMELLAGFRRLEACKILGFNEIECNIIPVRSKIDKLQIESDENLTRKDFTSYEIEKINEIKRYLTATGFEKLFLWIKRIFSSISLWIKKILHKLKHRNQI